MVDLAEHHSDDFTPLQDICDRQEISKEYLSSILKVLVQHGLLLSLRGKGGGYKLKGPPSEYTVGMILRPVEGNLAPVQCVEHCRNSCRCRSLPMWQKLDRMINDFFDHITLQDLLEQPLEDC